MRRLIALLLLCCASGPAEAEVSYRKGIELASGSARTLDVVNRLGSVSVLAWGRPRVRVIARKRALNAQLAERLRVEVAAPSGQGRIRVRTFVRVPMQLPEKLQAAIESLMKEHAVLVRGLLQGRLLPHVAKRRLRELKAELATLRARVAKHGRGVTGDLGVPLSEGRLDIEVRIPREMRVLARTLSHGITLQGGAGGEVSTESGSILVKGVEGPVRTWNQRGPQRLERIGGRVWARGDSADIELVQIGGQVRAALLSGDIRARRMGSRHAVFETVSGNIELAPARRGRYRISSILGQVVLHLPVRPDLLLGGVAAVWDDGAFGQGYGEKTKGARTRRFGKGTTAVQVRTEMGRVQLRLGGHGPRLESP